METIQKGDKWIVRGTLTDDSGTGIAFANLNEMTVLTEEDDGTNRDTYTKTATTIVVNPNDANGYQFEVTVAQTNAYTVNKIIYGVFTLNIPNAAFSASEQIVVKRERLFEVTSGG